MFTKKVLRIVSVLVLLTASYFSVVQAQTGEPVRPAQAQTDEPGDDVSIDVVHQGATTIVTVHHAWECCNFTSNRPWTSVQYVYPDIILTFTNFDFGRIYIFNFEWVYIKTLIWSRQFFGFQMVPDHIKIGQSTDLNWGRYNSGRAVVYTTVVPPETGCATCNIQGSFPEVPGYPEQEIQTVDFMGANVGTYVLTTTFTETVSGFVSVITDTLVVEPWFNYLPVVQR